MKSSIYADNASTTQLDPGALEAMLPFMRAGNFRKMGLEA
jgi:cysteine sulfinate desulfinase/cysteine desulfurase-like protein